MGLAPKPHLLSFLPGGATGLYDPRSLGNLPSCKRTAAFWAPGLPGLLPAYPGGGVGCFLRLPNQPT